MTRKTNTEWIQELNTSVASLGTQVEYIAREVERVRDWKDESSDRLNALQKDLDDRHKNLERMLIDRIADQAREIAVLTDFKKRIESQERVRWLFWIAFAGSLLTLAGNIVILFLNR